MKSSLLGLLIFLFAPICFASSEHNYEEERIHLKKVEMRLQGWEDRTMEHEKMLETSDHPKLVKWRKQMKNITFTNELEELNKINSLMNSDVRYRDDYSHFHKKDYWADPVTTLDEGGDCEDIALLKFASLHRLGWPEDRTHLLMGYLTERGKKESHAVLMVETREGQQLVLRSITDQVIPPDQFGFIPIYAVDNKGVLIVKADFKK